MGKGQTWYSVHVDKDGNVTKSDQVAPPSFVLDAAGRLFAILVSDCQAQAFAMPPFPPTASGWAKVDGEPTPSGPALGA